MSNVTRGPSGGRRCSIEIAIIGQRRCSSGVGHSMRTCLQKVLPTGMCQSTDWCTDLLQISPSGGNVHVYQPITTQFLRQVAEESTWFIYHTELGLLVVLFSYYRKLFGKMMNTQVIFQKKNGSLLPRKVVHY